MGTKTDIRILAFGDSLVAGYHAGGRQHSPFTDTLAKCLTEAGIQAEIDNRGKDGASTGYMVQTVAQLFEQNKYDYMIFLGGTNDFGRADAEDFIVNNINTVHSLVRSKGTKTFAVTIPETAQDARLPWLAPLRGRINDKIRKQYADELVELEKGLPYFSLNGDDKKLYWDDTLHFTPKGYEKMGYIVWDAIKDKLSKSI